MGGRLPVGAGSWLGWVVPLFIAAGAFWGTYTVTKKLLPGPKPERTWSVLSGKPAPIDFLFLMFPANDSVPLYDAPNGKQVGVLQRALGNIAGEVNGTTWVQVPPNEPGGQTLSVRTIDLRYVSPAVAGTMAPFSPDGPRPPNYVANFAAAYRARKPDEGRSATYMLHTGVPDHLLKETVDRGGGRVAAFQLREGGNRRDYYALVTADKAVPLAIDQLYEGSRFTSSIIRWLISGVASLIVAFAVWLGVVALWQNRLSRRSEDAPPAREPT